MPDKRIIDYNEAESLSSDDYLIIDGSTNGTRKIDPNKLVKETDKTLSVENSPADAKTVGDELNDVKADLNDLILINLASNVTFSNDIQIQHASGSIVISSYWSASDFVDISDCETILYMRVYANNTSAPANGMAFYDENKTYISGISSAYKSGGGDPYLYEAPVPNGAKYARFTYFRTDNPYFETYPFAVYNAEQYHASLVTIVAGHSEAIDKIEAQQEEINDNLLNVPVTFDDWILGRSIGATGGATNASGSATTPYSPVQKPFFRGGSLVDGDGTTLNCFVCQWNNGTFISRTGFNVLDTPFTFDENCTHWRIVIGYAASTGKTMTQEIIDTYFKPYTLFNSEKTVNDIKTLKAYHPDYSGKKLSILGDSISTFVASADEVDGKAPEGCTTTYPGNVTQYANSDVTSASLTWWGRVIEHFGMNLGINESWAGSCIAYNPNQTSGGKYTADNCLCSETRIGHLGENGTPDIIIVFGGTNDINHHLAGTSTVRYAVGELDSVHNPYDFENFPMITDTYYGSITTMLLRIQHEYPNATILMLLPYFCTYTHTSSGDIATPQDQNTWCNVAKDVCEFLGVEYLDLRTIINMYDVSTLLFGGLHPKANGMEAIAKAVIHKLNNML